MSFKVSGLSHLDKAFVGSFQKCLWKHTWSPLKKPQPIGAKFFFVSEEWEAITFALKKNIQCKFAVLLVVFKSGDFRHHMYSTKLYLLLGVCSSRQDWELLLMSSRTHRKDVEATSANRPVGAAGGRDGERDSNQDGSFSWTLAMNFRVVKSLFSLILAGGMIHVLLVLRSSALSPLAADSTQSTWNQKDVGGDG